ncbi:MAG: 2-phosphosulfolactate phosphatase [Solirubrobacteraceae bacterium]
MPQVSIDCFHEHLEPVKQDTIIVAVDVIRATTTAVTAVTMGWRVYPAGSIERAVRLAADLDRPILAGELGGVMPYGFDIQNSPTKIAALESSDRPIILLSTSGTRLIAEATRHGVTCVACLRNVSAQSDWLVRQNRDVLILGADSRGEFREEDQLCAARIAGRLARSGFDVADPGTASLLERMSDATETVVLEGRSASYLRDTGQDADLDFVTEHIDDLRDVFVVRDGQVSSA